MEELKISLTPHHQHPWFHLHLPHQLVSLERTSPCRYLRPWWELPRCVFWLKLEQEVLVNWRANSVAYKPLTWACIHCNEGVIWVLSCISFASTVRDLLYLFRVQKRFSAVYGISVLWCGSFYTTQRLREIRTRMYRYLQIKQVWWRHSIHSFSLASTRLVDLNQIEFVRKRFRAT